MCNNTKGGHNCTCKPGFIGDRRNCAGETDFQVFGFLTKTFESSLLVTIIGKKLVLRMIICGTQLYTLDMKICIVLFTLLPVLRLKDRVPLFIHTQVCKVYAKLRLEEGVNEWLVGYLRSTG